MKTKRTIDVFDSKQDVIATAAAPMADNGLELKRWRRNRSKSDGATKASRCRFEMRNVPSTMSTPVCGQVERDCQWIENAIAAAEDEDGSGLRRERVACAGCVNDGVDLEVRIG